MTLNLRSWSKTNIRDVNLFCSFSSVQFKWIHAKMKPHFLRVVRTHVWQGQSFKKTHLLVLFSSLFVFRGSLPCFGASFTSRKGLQQSAQQSMVTPVHNFYKPLFTFFLLRPNVFQGILEVKLAVEAPSVFFQTVTFLTVDLENYSRRHVDLTFFLKRSS